MTDLPRNNLVPKHEILDKKGVKKLLETYNVTKDKLPKISKDDPAIQGLEAQNGDVIKISRHQETTGNTLYYRVVVEAD